MTAGRDALHQIDASIAEARRNLGRASDAAATDARLIAELDQRQVAVYQRLAELRIVDLKNGAPPLAALGDVDRRADGLIDQHAAALARMTAAREAAAQKLDQIGRAHV